MVKLRGSLNLLMTCWKLIIASSTFHSNHSCLVLVMVIHVEMV